ncbi:retrovirus-related pol polyprotein from transposon TNT 1-94, partial [Tanacetum coccineum]
AARTMVIFSKLLEFLWAEAISTACFTLNHSSIYKWYNKTPYELLRGRKPNVEYFYVFGSLCYPTNDQEDLGKMKPKAYIGIFIGYSKFRDVTSSSCVVKQQEFATRKDLTIEVIAVTAAISRSHRDKTTEGLETV